MKADSFPFNRVKQKFVNEDIKNFIVIYDFLIIMETHFMKRHECPDKYSLLSRSIPLSNKVGRGGVAVYIKKWIEC